MEAMRSYFDSNPLLVTENLAQFLAVSWLAIVWTPLKPPSDAVLF